MQEPSRTVIVTRLAQRGLGLVELMVGITVGLIVTAGASMVAVNQINEHRRLMMETQIQQDLRTAADLIQQDIRRAGFRGLYDVGVWAPASGVGTAQEVPAAAPSPNTYSPVTVSEDQQTMTYSYARTPDSGNKGAPLSNENFGIQFKDRALYLQVGTVNDKPNWQPITDPDTVEILNFKIEPIITLVDLADFCDKVCTGSGCPAGPQQEVRRVEITLQGRATRDQNVVRTLSVKERLRSDNVKGACPT